MRECKHTFIARLSSFWFECRRTACFSDLLATVQDPNKRNSNVPHLSLQTSFWAGSRSNQFTDLVGCNHFQLRGRRRLVHACGDWTKNSYSANGCKSCRHCILSVYCTDFTLPNHRFLTLNSQQLPHVQPRQSFASRHPLYSFVLTFWLRCIWYHLQGLF